MTDSLSSEIIGDWNNLKGTEYHLVYTLWLLVRRRVSTVAFYEGNDLLMRHTIPPTKHEDSQPPISMGAHREDEDHWIQLKATKAPWTLTKILRGNLLKNFIFNALKSQSEDRKWRTQLVTQGVIRSSDVREFAAGPSKKPQLYTKVEEVINEVFESCREIEAFSHVGKEELRSLALEILAQLAENAPLPLSTIKAEIEVELALAYPSREAVKQIENTLLGALLKWTAEGPGDHSELNLDWLNTAAGRSIVRRGLLETDPQKTFAETVTSAVRDWQLEQSIGRQSLEDALARFMESDRTTFVLVGVSGVGKSWALAHWASTKLGNQAYVFIPGIELIPGKTLSTLVAGRLRYYTNANWQDDTFLQRLVAKSVEQAHTFPIIIIDDLFVPHGSAEVFRRTLANVVDQARQYNAKLILSCQKHIWQFNRLAKEIPHQELYWEQSGGVPVGHESLDSERVPRHTQNKQIENEEIVSILSVGHLSERISYPRFSFELFDFSALEVRQFLTRKIADRHVEKVAAWLRSPSLLFLRRPYYLALFLKEHGQKLSTDQRWPPIIDASELLDRWIGERLDQVSGAVGCSLADSRMGLQELAKAIWDERPVGLTYAASIHILETYFPEQARTALGEMRQAGLLTSQGNIRFAEPPVAEHYFGQQLRRWLESDEELITNLRPEEDSGVVTAMLRAPTSNIDLIWLSESLVARDERWVDAVAHGLAQYPQYDHRILALLTSLTRPPSNLILHPEATKALGELAARERQPYSQALKWVARMYLTRSEDSYRGARALATVVNYSPERVEAIFRLKLRQLQTIDGNKHQGEWNEVLRIALTPYSNIANVSAAAAALRSLDLVEALAAKEHIHLATSTIRTIEEVRGSIAVFNEEQKTYILEQLESTDPKARFQAACALRVMLFERLSSVEGALLEAIAREQDGQILSRLLWAVYPLVARVPIQLLVTLENGKKLNWSNSSPAAGLILTVLGDLAEYAPERIASHLPQTLDSYPEKARALLSEMYAYALWRCAEYTSSVRQSLQELAKPNLANLPIEFHIFAIRGALIAQLGLMCLDAISSGEFIGRQSTYEGSELQFLYLLEGGDFVKKNADHLLQHADYPIFEDLLIECISQETQVDVDFRDRFLLNARFRCAYLCLDMLAALAVAMSDSPIRLIEALPPGWQSLNLCRRILEAGRNEEDVTAHVKALCTQFENVAAGQVHHERIFCLAHLAILGDDPEKALADYKGSDDNLLSGRDEVQGLAYITDANPEKILILLDQSITSQNDLPLLFYWQEIARSWRSTLLASVIARMFDTREITVKEATLLCEQVLAVVESLPDSQNQYEYTVTYRWILNWLRGEVQSDTPLLTSVPQSLLQKSHFRALALLATAKEKLLIEDFDGPWISQSLEERDGWLESSKYHIKNGTLNWGFGGGIYCIYVFPAVRLTLVAIGKRFGVSDPAGNFMKGRYEANQLLKKHRRVLNPQHIKLERDRQRLEMAVHDIEKRVNRLQDERLYDVLSFLLIFLGELQRAKTILLKGLSMKLCQGKTRASLLYNLACVSARQGQEDDCRLYLNESDNLVSLDRERVMRDPDLEAVRDKKWFQALLSSK